MSISIFKWVSKTNITLQIKGCFELLEIHISWKRDAFLSSGEGFQNYLDVFWKQHTYTAMIFFLASLALFSMIIKSNKEHYMAYVDGQQKLIFMAAQASTFSPMLWIYVIFIVTRCKFPALQTTFYWHKKYIKTLASITCWKAIQGFSFGCHFIAVSVSLTSRSPAASVFIKSSMSTSMWSTSRSGSSETAIISMLE